VLGRIVGLFGVQGWVKVFSYTRPREGIFDYRQWLLRRNEGWHAARLRQGRPQGKGLVAWLEGLDDRDQASEWIGADIAVEAEHLPPAGEGEYYWWQLEGLRVINSEGIELGRVGHLFETGANDVLVVDGDRQRLIPYIPDVVRDVDLEAGVIRVEWDADF
jgi:16S rRNA processing protein RimM